MIFLMYLLESGVCTAILWGSYYALLRGEAHFAFNRFYLLSIIPLSSLIPLLRLPLLAPEESPAMVTIGELPVGTLAGAPVEQSFSVAALLLVIYLLGAGVFAFRFCRQLYRMRRMMAASGFSETKNFSAFTFFRKIYINKSVLSAGDYEKILWHEQVHARQLHSIDLAVAQLFVMLQWFNPFAWRLKTSIVATHEYLADAQVLARGVDVNIYQKLLFRQTAGAYPGHASGFSYSLTKKRLIMMTKNKRGKFFALKLFGLLPALALPVALFGLSTAESVLPVNPENVIAETVLSHSPDTVFITWGKDSATTIASLKQEIAKQDLLNPDNIVKITIQKDTDTKSSNGKITVIKNTGETVIFDANDKQPLASLNPSDISSITVEKDNDVIIRTKSGETVIFDGNDKQALLAGNIRVVATQKDTAKTKKVIRFTTPVKSEKDTVTATAPPPPPLKDKVDITISTVYLAGEVEENPQFPEGQAALLKFISDNLKYPKEAASRKIEGRVTVEFVVKADGRVSDVKVLRSVDPLLDEEAVRVIKAMPRWTPGKQEGKPVAVRFILPVSFKIPEDKAK
ncbi:MAG: TonB family protein [Prevotellaceae bacterium]|jgi:TonB family protein|nr:TonB family protein [Prevotellaceae bacterium]